MGTSKQLELNDTTRERQFPWSWISDGKPERPQKDTEEPEMRISKQKKSVQKGYRLCASGADIPEKGGTTETETRFWGAGGGMTARMEHCGFSGRGSHM